jgi:HEAT repeat protein
MVSRTNRGTFKPGHSGNPGGKPAVAAEVRALAAEHSAEAIETLVAIMRDKSAASTSRAAAANSLLDRAIGKPELSAKIETSQAKEPDFSRLTDEEFAKLEAHHAELTPIIEKLYGPKVESMN